MFSTLLVIDVLVSIGLIVLILLQHGKGADAGAAFGSGASQTVFGSQGTASFLTRSTAVLAIIFFTTSLALAYISGHSQNRSSAIDLMAPQQTAPVIPKSTTPKPPPPKTDIPTLPQENATPSQPLSKAEQEQPGKGQQRPASDVPAP